MSRRQSIVTEYRNYYLEPSFPVLLLTGPNWKISDVPSGRLHFHNCLEIGICHSFSGTLEIFDSKYSFSEGDVTCIPRNIPHTTYSDSGNESLWSYLFFDYNELFKEMLPASFYGFDLSKFADKFFYPVFRKNEFPNIRLLVLSIIEELQGKRTGYQYSAKGLLLSLFVEIWRARVETNYSSSANLLINTDESQMILNPALSYIEKNYMNSFTIETLADISHLSPTHFRRIFHSIMGSSPLEYLNRTRIQKACLLLRSTEESILSISENVGFRSVSSFNRSFIQIMNVNPRTYRMEVRKKDKKNERQIIMEFTGWMSPESFDKNKE